MSGEKFNPEDPNINENTEFFRIGPLMDLYREKFENPEAVGSMVLSVVGVERPGK